MEKLKVKIVPDWRELGKVVRFALMVMGLIFLASMAFITCADEFYFGKSRDELNAEVTKSMFEVDSLVLTIKKDLDSLDGKRN